MDRDHAARDALESRRVALEQERLRLLATVEPGRLSLEELLRLGRELAALDRHPGAAREALHQLPGAGNVGEEHGGCPGRRLDHHRPHTAPRDGAARGHGAAPRRRHLPR